MKIKVIIKQPGRNPYSTWIENSLENLKDTVGGSIEIFHKGGMSCICNEAGKVFPPNFYIGSAYRVIHGTVIFCGITRKGHLARQVSDCPMTYHEIKKMWPQLWEPGVATI